jgi:glycosyltransferase involved in cell wall biosynthesis
MTSVCILLQNHYEIDIRARRKAEALVSAGYSVDVLALRSSYSTSRDYILDGVNIYTVSLGKRRGSIVRYIYEYFAFLLWCFVKVSRLMGKRHYAIIDANNLPDFLVFAGAYARWKGAKIVFDMHEITPEFYASKYKVKQNSWLVRILIFVERISVDFADHVITINDPIEDLLIERGLSKSKSTIIMNSVDETFFTSPRDANGLVAAIADPAKFVMMYHGTLTHIYGLDIAVEAFAVAHQEMPGAEMWIVGSGPEKSPIEALSRSLGLESKIKCIGRVLPQEVPLWLKRCDIGMLPTRQDPFLDLSFSSKLSEYIIMGKAVIASRLKTINCYFSDEALAFFEPNNPSDLAQRMIEMYQSPSRRAQLAAKAREEFVPIRWEVMKERYLKLIHDLSGHAVVNQTEAFAVPRSPTHPSGLDRQGSRGTMPLVGPKI